MAGGVVMLLVSGPPALVVTRLQSVPLGAMIRHRTRQGAAMHRRLAIVTITFTLAMTGVDMAAQTRGPERPADAAAIRAHIESIFQAFVDKDCAKLEATHSSEWRGFTPVVRACHPGAATGK